MLNDDMMWSERSWLSSSWATGYTTIALLKLLWAIRHTQINIMSSEQWALKNVYIWNAQLRNAHTIKTTWNEPAIENYWRRMHGDTEFICSFYHFISLVQSLAHLPFIYEFSGADRAANWRQWRLATEEWIRIARHTRTQTIASIYIVWCKRVSSARMHIHVYRLRV